VEGIVASCALTTFQPSLLPEVGPGLRAWNSAKPAA